AFEVVLYIRRSGRSIHAWPVALAPVSILPRPQERQSRAPFSNDIRAFKRRTRMKTPRKGIRLLNPNEEAVEGFTTAVSLHCHTDQSRESLDFVPHYASKIPLVSQFLVRELEQYAARNGEAIDFARAF